MVALYLQFVLYFGEGNWSDPGCDRQLGVCDADNAMVD